MRITMHPAPRTAPKTNPPRRHGRRALGLALVAVLGLSACHDEASKAAEVEGGAAVSPKPGAAWAKDDKRWGWLSCEKVTAGAPLALLPVPGKVAPVESATWAIQPPLEGRVDQLYVRVGQRVEAGAPLVRLRSSGLTDLRREQAIAQQAVALRTQQLAHAKTLAAAHAIAEKDLLGAQQDLSVAELDLRSATHKLASLQVEAVDDSSYVCRAPRAGVVIRADATPGQVSGPGTLPLLTLAQLDRLVVWAQVLASDVGDVHLGDQAIISTPGRDDAKTEARVESIASAVDPDTHTVGVRLVTAGAPAWLLPNSFVQVAFQRRGGRAVVVPAEAVLTDDLRSIVFVKHPDGRLERREVAVGTRSSSRCEIVRGLRPGETIVVKGAILLLNEVES